MHVFVGVREFEVFARVVYGGVSQDQVGAMMGVNVLGGKGLGAVPIDRPGAVVTHLDKFLKQKSIGILQLFAVIYRHIPALKVITL